MKALSHHRFPFRLFFRDTVDLLSKSFAVFLWSVILTAFFLFLFHIFVWVSWQTRTFSDTIRNKLGIYFYVKDASDDAQTYSRVIELQDNLDAYWFVSSFRSKEQALSVLFGDNHKALLDKFRSYGMDNPLPATLYVSFNDENELDILKKLVYKYRDVISNVWDLDTINTLKKQEERSVRAISFSRFIFDFSLVVLVIMFVAIFTMLLYLLKTLFFSFSQKLEVQTILWAYHLQIIAPYVFVSLITLLLSFFLMTLLVIGSVLLLDSYLLQHFSIHILRDYLLPYKNDIISLFFYELLGLLLFWCFVSYFYISYLLRRVSYE